MNILIRFCYEVVKGIGYRRFRDCQSIRNAGGNAMVIAARQVNTVKRDPDRAIKRNRFFPYLPSYKRILPAVLILLAVYAALLIPAQSSAHASVGLYENESIAPVQPTAPPAEEGGGASDMDKLSIQTWQGAKNYGDAFHVTIDGPDGAEVRLAGRNCSVSPHVGTVGQTFTVTIDGAGAYALTAASDSAKSDTKKGFAGKADQAPLQVEGWRGARNYYHVFDISVSGGSTGGIVSFETKGCSVTPAEGTTESVYTVTVTSVGGYELTAMMAGNEHYATAYSMTRSGCANKANQAPIVIDDWVSDAYCGETFTIRVAGGSTSEPLVVEAIGCTVTKINSKTYEICVTSAGPYAVSATRAGNYGYHPSAASACGVSCQADQPRLSLSGWMDNRNCADSFPITVTGGASDATVRFTASGCTVTPASGKTGDRFTVHISSVGEYSLTAHADASARYAASQSRTYKGVSGKGAQPTLSVNNWNGNAENGSSFEIVVSGGGGTGGTSITTQGGCTAMLKSGESNVYIVTVTGTIGQQYGLVVGKSGDESYHAAVSKTIHGTIAQAPAPVTLNVSGWNDASASGESFTIRLSCNADADQIVFDPTGCTVKPADGSDAYTVTVTAEPGEPYALTISHAEQLGQTRAFVRHNGSVRTAPALQREHASGVNGTDQELYALKLTALGLLLAIVFVCVLLVRARREE